MSNLKISENLFLGVAELDRFKKFLQEDGFEFNVRMDGEEFGIIYNKFIDPNFNFFKVTPLLSNDGIYVAPGFAYDKYRKLLSSNGVTIQMNDLNVWYWLKIKHSITTVEKGTVKIGGTTGGLMQGVGTEFKKLFRGQPEFPTKIRFTNSVNYALEYEVLSVVDDNTAQIQGTFEIQETDLKYEIIGTFTPAYYPTEEEKRPFEYDDFVYELVPEVNFNEIPPYVEGEEFYIARCRVVLGGVEVQDYRRKFMYKSRSERYFEELPTTNNPLIAIESITRTQIRGAMHYGVKVGWGFNVGTEVRNQNSNKVLITEGSGGAYKTKSAFLDKDFDGWRYYYVNGEYSRIISSIKTPSGDIELQLDTLLHGQNGSMICPNAEEVEFRLNYYNTSNIMYASRLHKFYSYTKNAMIIIPENEVLAFNKKVEVFHRFKSNYKLTVEASLKQNSYDLENIGQITDKDIVLSAIGGGSPTGTAWRGLNPFCETYALPSAVYYKIVTRNPGGPTTTWDPDSVNPDTSVTVEDADLYVEFYSDPARTTPVNVTQTNLIVSYLRNEAIQETIWDVPTPGSSITTNKVQQFVETMLIDVAGVDEKFLGKVSTDILNKEYPTNDPGLPRQLFHGVITFTEFPETNLIDGRTGRQGFTDLEEYDTANNLPTGITKPNINSDPDYIAPSSDLANCPVAVESLEVNYGYELNMKKLVMSAVSRTETMPLVADTESGGYIYKRKRFVVDEGITVTARGKALPDSNNNTGYVWVRVTWRDIGATSDTLSTHQIPDDVETVLPVTYRNIKSVTISNF